ncbi:cerebellin 18 [Polymixia lowei]
MSELDDSIRETLGGSRVAFTASLGPREHCFGPFSNNISIPYGVITLNHGNGYKPALGTFTAPRPGLYSFSFSAYSRVRWGQEKVRYQVQLMRNGEVIASGWEDHRLDWEDTSSQAQVLVHLARGGQVRVELLAGRQLCGDVKGRNVFSGYLVYPTEV